MPVPEKTADDGMYSFFENTKNHLFELKHLTSQMKNKCQQMLEVLHEIDKEDEDSISPITLAK